MFNDGFIKLLHDYPDSILDYQKLSGLLRDIFPEEIKLIRLLLNLHEIGIHNEIASTDYISRQFAYKYKKRLIDEYGIGDENAHRGVYVWCFCYGKKILGKSCEITEADEDYTASTVPVIPETEKMLNKDRLDIAIQKSSNVSSNKSSHLKYFSYTTKNNSVQITAYIGFDQKHIVIPDTIDGLPVKRIENAVFKNSPLKSIVLPNTLEEIGDSAFESCESLKSIHLPDSLLDIRCLAFACTSLYSVVIPENVKLLHDAAFGFIFSLKHIAILGEHTRFYESPFRKCPHLTIYCLPSSNAQQHARNYKINLKPLKEFPRD